MATDLTPDQRMAVSCAVGRAARRRHGSLGYDDLYQIGAEAVLKAKIDETMDPPQRHVYLERRAWGAMIDATRSAFRSVSLTGFDITVGSSEDDPTEMTVIDYTAADPGSAPDRLAAVHEACARIERMPEPCPTVATMSADGADCEEIAAALGVSISRVSQHRATIRKVIERYI